MPIRANTEYQNLALVNTETTSGIPNSDRLLWKHRLEYLHDWDDIRILDEKKILNKKFILDFYQIN